jgi:MarR family 2-MHQ and catechol resistance regulon transcriptional repressor
MEKKSIEKLAAELAELTCELGHVCTDKQNYFASMFNLTPAEFKCLRLFGKKTSLSVKEICSLLALTPGRITHIITSLEEKKFVIRRIDQTDKRNVIVQLTNNCIPFLKNLTASHIQVHEELLSKIPEANRESVIHSVNEILKAIKSWSQDETKKK